MISFRYKTFVLRKNILCYCYLRFGFLSWYAFNDYSAHLSFPFKLDPLNHHVALWEIVIPLYPSSFWDESKVQNIFISLKKRPRLWHHISADRYLLVRLLPTRFWYCDVKWQRIEPAYILLLWVPISKDFLNSAPPPSSVIAQNMWGLQSIVWSYGYIIRVVRQ